MRGLWGREIGFVGQEPMIGLNPSLRVGAQLAELVRLHHRCTRRAARQQVVALLGSVRLPNPGAVARKYPHELSGGMAQRVAIARALSGPARLLIADEPTTALDVTVQAGILDLLREQQDERGMAMLIITHDWGVVADSCDRAVVMYAGEVVEVGGVERILLEPLHPYTHLLQMSDPHRASGGEELPTIPGRVPDAGSWDEGCRFARRCPRATEECRKDPVPMRAFGDGSFVRCVRPLGAADR